MRMRECPQNYSSVRREGGGTRTVVRGKGEWGGGGGRQKRAPQSTTRVHGRRIILLLSYAMPVEASRTSRLSRGAPSPTPLQPHPNQVLPAAQVRGQTFILRDSGQETRGSMTSAGCQSVGCRLPTDGRQVTTGAAGGGRST